MLACKGIFTTPSIGICRLKDCKRVVNSQGVLQSKNSHMPIITRPFYKVNIEHLRFFRPSRVLFCRIGAFPSSDALIEGTAKKSPHRQTLFHHFLQHSGLSQADFSGGSNDCLQGLFFLHVTFLHKSLSSSSARSRFRHKAANIPHCFIASSLIHSMYQEKNCYL